MTLQGYDLAWGWSGSLPAALKAKGGQFVIRYIGTSSKCLTPAELHGWHQAGMSVGMVYETTGTTWRGGRAAGERDGAAALAAATALGAPAGSLIWFAIDEDATDYATAAAYLQGCQAASGAYHSYLYGGAHLIDGVWAHVNGRGWFWQTYAWSNGEVSKHAIMYQYHNDVTIDGVSCDQNKSINTGVNGGTGWLMPVIPAPTTPKPIAVAVNKTVAAVKAQPAPVVAAVPVATVAGVTASSFPSLSASQWSTLVAAVLAFLGSFFLPAGTTAPAPTDPVAAAPAPPPAPTPAATVEPTPTAPAPVVVDPTPAPEA